MKGAKRGMEIILTFFLKKDLIQGSFVILVQKWYVIITFWICSQICTIKGTKKYMKIFIVIFLRKNLIWRNLIFLGCFLLLDLVRSKLSQAIVTNGSLSSQDIIRIHD